MGSLGREHLSFVEDTPKPPHPPAPSPKRGEGEQDPSPSPRLPLGEALESCTSTKE